MFLPKPEMPAIPGILLIIALLMLSGLVQAEGNSSSKADSRVALFSQPFCPGCEAAKSYFHNNDIAYVEFDITASDRARDAFMRLGGRGTPFLMIGGKRVHGFSVPMVRQRLLQAGILEDTQ